MPLLLGCLGLAFPRFVLVLVWLFGGGYIGRAFDTVLWPILGFFFLPLTTLAFVYSMNSLGMPGEVPPLGWVLVGLGAVSDLGLLGNGERGRRRHRRRRDED
ncbi:MAG: hypothetical protein KC933_21750 [Myxococcales bacterium]|nr:hypothetical protein [Myxococcales bacterium]MCA9552673.1 hypothetical protein [Myxococcales bacterium]MCB9649900.1 hypothetical protein [Deltaproteobacteria bacterium]